MADRFEVFEDSWVKVSDDAEAHHFAPGEHTASNAGELEALAQLTRTDPPMARRLSTSRKVTGRRRTTTRRRGTTAPPGEPAATTSVPEEE